MTLSLFENAELIHVYSRAQAIADGVLLDVTTIAREAGWRVPVALTAAVWGDCVAWDQFQHVHQDESGRLWDVLVMARLAAHSKPNTGRLNFTLVRVPRGGWRPLPVRLAVEIGPGDAGEPVITIMQPDED